MKEKINIIQFMPYFPPHRWWVENVWEEIGNYWSKKDLWNFINVVFDVWQTEKNHYEKNWYKVYLIPSFDLISNFPFPKFWKKEFFEVFKLIKKDINSQNPPLTPPLSGGRTEQEILQEQNFRVITHTRFFLSSLIWWIFARKNKIKWIHIEHGSSYIKLSSKIKYFLSIIYDKIFWKWIFKKAYKVLAISWACKKFILEKFINREVEVFYRGLDLSSLKTNKSWDVKLVYVWRLVSLKWVSDLVDAYKKSKIKNELIIIWDWEEKQNLEIESNWINVKFLWYKDREFVINYLSKNNCILVNPSYSEWMPTTVIEALATWCVVIASDVWWTSEISDKDDLILFEAWDIEWLKDKLIFWIDGYSKLNWLSFSLINDSFDWNRNIFKFYELIK
jgi:hypothetical protein